MDNLIRPLENVNLIPGDRIASSDGGEWLHEIHLYEWGAERFDGKRGRTARSAG